MDPAGRVPRRERRRRVERAYALAPAADRRIGRRLLGRSREAADVARLPRGARPARHRGGDPRARPGAADLGPARDVRGGAAPLLRAGARGAAEAPVVRSPARPAIRADGRAGASRARRSLARAIRDAALPRRAAPGRHGQRQDRGLPAGDRRGARGRAGRDLARAGDRADARLRPRLSPPVRRPGRRPALGALRAGARRGLGARAERPGRAPSSGRVRRPSRRSPIPGSSSWTRSTTPPTSSASRRATTRARSRRSAPARASAALVFGSATPSIEAYHAAREGRLAPPRAHVARRDAPSAARSRSWTCKRETGASGGEGRPALLAAARRASARVFAAGEQAILLQPRRGFAPFLLCRDCGFDFRCAQCSVSAHGARPRAIARLPLLRRARAAARAVSRTAAARSSRRSAPAPSAWPTGSRRSSRESLTRSSTATRRAAAVPPRSSRRWRPAASPA